MHFRSMSQRTTGLPLCAAPSKRIVDERAARMPVLAHPHVGKWLHFDTLPIESIRPRKRARHTAAARGHAWPQDQRPHLEYTAAVRA